MSHLPINPLSPEEQQRVMKQMYLLMGKQVQSYHKHRHMGNNSSVPVELAQELMESIEYTIGLVGGVYAHKNIGEALVLGQEVLESKLSKAKSMLELVNGTAPQWQTECRWEALRYLRHYLEQYDHLHLAHKGPDDLFYPILISPPEGIRGIDSCIFYLNILWIENQIMAGVPEDSLEQFWDRLPAASLNQCEHLLINGIGKALLRTGIDSPFMFPSMILFIKWFTKEAAMSNNVITTFLTCPVCQKAKILSYGASGKISSHCPICRRTIMWDFDNHKAYPISNYPSNNLKHAN